MRNCSSASRRARVGPGARCALARRAAAQLWERGLEEKGKHDPEWSTQDPVGPTPTPTTTTNSIRACFRTTRVSWTVELAAAGPARAGRRLASPHRRQRKALAGHTANGCARVSRYKSTLTRVPAAAMSQAASATSTASASPVFADYVYVTFAPRGREKLSRTRLLTLEILTPID